MRLRKNGYRGHSGGVHRHRVGLPQGVTAVCIRSSIAASRDSAGRFPSASTSCPVLSVALGAELSCEDQVTRGPGLCVLPSEELPTTFGETEANCSRAQLLCKASSISCKWQELVPGTETCSFTAEASYGLRAAADCPQATGSCTVLLRGWGAMGDSPWPFAPPEPRASSGMDASPQGTEQPRSRVESRSEALRGAPFPLMFSIFFEHVLAEKPEANNCVARLANKIFALGNLLRTGDWGALRGVFCIWGCQSRTCGQAAQDGLT